MTAVPAVRSQSYDITPAPSVSTPAPLDHLGNKSGPPCLMAGTEPLAGISVEIFIEKNKVSEMGIGPVPFLITVDRPSALPVPAEYLGHELGKLLGHIPEADEVSGA